MRSRQRWRLMSLLSPSGKSLIISISSSPPIAAHLWRSKWRTLCLNRDGSCLLLIHHSISRHLSCIFLFFAMTACKNTWEWPHLLHHVWVWASFYTYNNNDFCIPECYQSIMWKAIVHWVRCICWKLLPASYLWVQDHFQKCCKNSRDYSNTDFQSNRREALWHLDTSQSNAFRKQFFAWTQTHSIILIH